MRNCNHALVRKKADRFPKLSKSDSNTEKTNSVMSDKTIIEIVFRKISLFVSISQINYLPQLNNGSSRH